MKQITIKCNICELCIEDLDDRLYGLSMDNGGCLEFSPVKVSTIHICELCLEEICKLQNTKPESKKD